MIVTFSGQPREQLLEVVAVLLEVLQHGDRVVGLGRTRAGR